MATVRAGLLLLLAACAAPREPSPRTGSATASGETPQNVPRMAHVASATFAMGSPVSDEYADDHRAAERPQREVHVREFWLACALVTAQEFSEFLNEAGNRGYLVEETCHHDWRTIRVLDDDRGSREPTATAGASRTRGRRYAPQHGAERAPAYPVTWDGAVAYCEWLSARLQHEFRLPTEAEWELAARGPELRPWPWGDEEPRTCDHRKPDSRTRVPFLVLHGPRWDVWPWEQRPPWPAEPVCSYPRNATPQGIHDLLGYHEPQWCADRAERRIARLPHTPEPMYVTRGRSIVVTGYDRRRTTPALARAAWCLLPRLLGHEGGEYTNIAGRSWSRVGENRLDGAMFRVASPAAPRWSARR